MLVQVMFASAQAKEALAISRGCGAVISVATQRRLIFEDLMASAEEVLGPMDAFQNLVGPFFTAWDSVMVLVKNIKVRRGLVGLCHCFHCCCFGKQFLAA